MQVGVQEGVPGGCGRGFLGRFVRQLFEKNGGGFLCTNKGFMS